MSVNYGFKYIYEHLKESGYDVYSMGQHKGLATAPYIVLKSLGATPVNSASDRQYELLLYMPEDRYSTMEDFCESVKMTMEQIRPQVVMYEDETEHYLDPDKKAYMTSLVYRSPRLVSYRCKQ